MIIDKNKRLDARYYHIDEWEYMVIPDLCQGHWGFGLYLRRENIGAWEFVVGCEDPADLHELIFDDEYMQPFRDYFLANYCPEAI